MAKFMRATMRDLDVPYTRKPSSWDDVSGMINADALPPLPKLPASMIDELLTIHVAAPQFFLVQVGSRTFLVNTEGYDYVRYAALVV